MKKIPDGDAVIRRVAELAFGRANDAVRLALGDAPDEARLGKMDLSLLSEVKRGTNGTVEVKLLDRLEALELLAKLVGAGGGNGQEAETFYAALEDSARELSGGEAG